jgi:hypothetical protein
MQGTFAFMRSLAGRKVVFLVKSYVLLVFINGKKNSDMMNTCLMLLMGKNGVSGVGN